jgi:phosphocarrier protein FPr
MIQLTDRTIRLHATARTKEDAIRAAGQLLVDSGHIEPGYVESMLRREGEANTFLGNGIAIPHGQGKDRELINRTGIAVVQVPNGVTWNTGETVQLVVGIAAKSDEHLQILANLTDVLDDPVTVQRLAHTDDANVIARTLSRGADEPAPEPVAAPPAPPAPVPTPGPPADEWSAAPYADVQIQGSAGLHARPAALLMQTARRFQSDVRLEGNGKTANGKALASILKLGVSGGQTIRLRARGQDADAALAALREAVESGLGEAEEPAPTAAQTAASAKQPTAWTPSSDVRTINGVGAAPGLAIGPIFQMKRTHVVVEDTPGDAAAQQEKLAQAVQMAYDQLGTLQNEVKARGGENEAAIFLAHQALLDDPELADAVKERISAGHGAAWSWNQVIDERAAELRQLSDERLAARAADLHDVGQRVLRLLVGTTDGSAPTMPDTPVIVVADDLAPSDTAQLDPKRVLGLCTAGGGPTSHTVIIARSLDLPAVVSAGAAVLEQRDGTVCVLDGSTGKLYIEPGETDLQSAKQTQAGLLQERDADYSTRYQPALLTDGHRVEVVANIGKAADAADAVQAGAEGVGLMRTEFLFLNRDAPPNEDEQYVAYRAMVESLNGLPLIIRTLDIGGDKAVPYLNLPHEDNPFLGVRGIRLCLRHPELFRPQLRAIYRAARYGPVLIMFPMIATLEDLREAKRFAEDVRQELGALPVEIGMMVEVPSTVAMAHEFAEEVDFFSVGTNDLTQYVLAIDRLHPALAAQVDSLHPAVLRMIRQVVEAADQAGKWVGVCGGIAGEPQGAVLLAGLGVKELSMSIPSVAGVKAQLRRVSFAQAKRVAQQALRCRTAAEVRALALPG